MRRRPVSVIEFAGYRRRSGELLTDEEQQAVVDLVAYEPTYGDVIPGTGGLRKLRIGRSGLANEAARGWCTIFMIKTPRSSCWLYTPRTRRVI